MIKGIVAISGQSGSGKSLLSSFFTENKKYKVVSVSKTMTEIFEKMIPNFYQISEEQRQNKILNLIKIDPDIASKTIFNKIKDFPNDIVVVLDGVRSEKDYATLLGQTKIIRIFMYSDFVTRAERVKNRDGKEVGDLILRDSLDNEIGLQEIFRKANYVVYNYHKIEIKEVKKQINQILIKEDIFLL